MTGRAGGGQPNVLSVNLVKARAPWIAGLLRYIIVAEGLDDV